MENSKLVRLLEACEKECRSLKDLLHDITQTLASLNSLKDEMDGNPDDPLGPLFMCGFEDLYRQMMEWCESEDPCDGLDGLRKMDQPKEKS
jgi:hypothetical protein